MTIWRLDVGRWRGDACRRLPWLMRCHEGCAILTLGPVCVTWLMGDCYPPVEVDDDDDDE